MGSIKVRCSLHRLTMWFHLDFAFATDFLYPDFRTDGRDKKLNRLFDRQPPWDGLTDVGRRITERILKINGVLELSARPEYFSIEVKRERDWPRILREIVKIIREESRDLHAVAKPHSDGERWHLPLLEELVA